MGPGGGASVQAWALLKRNVFFRFLMLSEIWRSRGPPAFHPPEALDAGVCLGVQLGQTRGAEEEAGAEAGVPVGLAKGAWGDRRPATLLFSGLWIPEVSPSGAELITSEFSEGPEIPCGPSSQGWRVGWLLCPHRRAPLMG